MWRPKDFVRAHLCTFVFMQVQCAYVCIHVRVCMCACVRASIAGDFQPEIGSRMSVIAKPRGHEPANWMCDAFVQT